MVKFANRVKVAITQNSGSWPGTGTLYLGSAATGYQSIPTSLNGETIRYVLEHGSTDWEIGSGTFSSSAQTLSRSLASSSTGSLLNINSAANIFISPSAEDLQYVEVYSSTSDLPSASSNHGRIAHVHGDGAMYFAHGGSWIRLGNHSDISSYSNATTSADGLMSSSDKTKLDGVATSANNYALPTATASALGGIKIGTGLSIDGSGVVTASGGSSSSSGGSLEPITTTKTVATAGETVFTGTWKAENISVFLNGVKLQDNEVTATDTQITISATAGGDVVEVVEYGAPFASPYASTFLEPNAGETSVTVNYTPDKVAVYRNGVKLRGGGEDFTASNGTSITGFSAFVANDVVEVVEHGSLANDSILDFTDTPSSLGTAGQILQVNSGANALEFADAASGVSTIGSLDFSPSAINETSTITTSSNMSNAPFISAFKEVPQVGVSSKGDWDVNSTASNYDILDEAPLSYSGVTLTPSNATADGTFSSSGVQFSNISAATYDNKNITTGDNLAVGIAFSVDGTRLYTAGDTSNDISQRILSTAWDVSTAGSLVDFSVSGQATTLDDVTFSTDGTKMYVLDDSDDVFQYTLSTAWDLSTASYDNVVFDVSSQNLNPRGIDFKTDGTKMYMVSASNTLHEYSLSTAWDISTASISVNLTANDLKDGATTILSTPTGGRFTSNGLYFLIVDSGNDKIWQYNLSTAWDISTLSYSGYSFAVNAQESVPNGLAISTNMGKVYVTGQNTDQTEQYSTNAGVFNPSDVGKQIAGNNGVATITSTAGAYSLTTAFTNTNTIAAGSWSLKGLAADSSARLKINGVINAFSLSSASYDSVNKSVSLQDGQPNSIAFNADGTKLFMLGNDNDSIFQYSLTAYDLSTLSYDSVSLSLSSQDPTVQSLTFGDSGNKMYMCGSSTDKVFQYSSTSPYDLSNFSYDNKTLDVSNEDTIPLKVLLSNDGSKLFLVGASSDSVHQYSLTTNFDISTASYDSVSLSVASQDTVPTGMSFNSDGTKLFVIGSQTDSVYQYNLPSAYNLTNASYDSLSFSMSSQMTNPRDVIFNNTGTKMYSVGSDNDKIYQYSSGELIIPTSQYLIATTNSSGQIDTTSWTDLNSLTADETLNGGATYYAFSTDGRTTWKVQDSSGNLRSIAKLNSGTWQYNNNATFGSETWVNATNNNQQSALQQALGAQAVNRLTGTSLATYSDANLLATGNTFDLMIGLYIGSAGTSPTSDAITINYDASIQNKGAILGTDYDVEKLSDTQLKFTALTQKNMHFKVI